MIIIESNINRKHIIVEIVRINILMIEQILERISKNIKKGSERNKKNYYWFERKIEKFKEKVDIHLK